MPITCSAEEIVDRLRTTAERFSDHPSIRAALVCNAGLPFIASMVDGGSSMAEVRHVIRQVSKLAVSYQEQFDPDSLSEDERAFWDAAQNTLRGVEPS